MRHPHILALFLVSLCLAGCVNDSLFECASSSECGDGTCESTGFCSFADSDCTTGRRYGEYASPEIANACVDAFAVTAATAEISPNNIFVGTGSTEFAYDLSLDIGDTDSGVDTISIVLPAAFGSPRVLGVAMGGLGTAFTDASSGSTLSIVLDDKVSESAQLSLRFACDAPLAADIVGEDFVASVDDSATDKPAQTVSEGNADGDAEDANRWSVTVSDGLPPVSHAAAEVFPKDVAIGSVDNLMSYEIDVEIEDGNSGVDGVSIAVPASFGLPVLEDVRVDGVIVAADQQVVDNSLLLSLSQRVEASATITVRFWVDSQDSEDSAGQAFRSTVSDSSMPLVAPTEVAARRLSSLSVTSTSWAAVSDVVAELSPNSATVGGSTAFTYDLLITVGESNSGVDTISLSIPSHLLVSAIDSVSVEGASVSYTSSVAGSEIEIELGARITSSSHVRLRFNGSVVACSNDQQGSIIARVDDASSPAAPQQGSAGNADQDGADANSLRVTSTGTPRLYWADNLTSKIQSGIQVGCSVDDLVIGLSNPRLIAVNLTTGKIYWADAAAGQIWRANLNGSGLEVIVTGLLNPSGIALDLSAGQLYWTEYGNSFSTKNSTDKIQRSDLDGNNKEVVLTSVGKMPYGIALDLSAGKMYWADTTDGIIQRADLDGENVETILTGLSQAADVVLAGSKLYASAHGSGTIVRANLDGSAPVNIISGQGEPIGLAFDAVDNRLYWADGGTDSIRSSDPDGSNISVMITGIGNPQGLALGR